MPKEEVNYKHKITVFRCPWHSSETCEYYRNHPWVGFSEEEAKKSGPFNWKAAIKERGSTVKMQEFVDWYNEEKGQKERT